ncbi:alpha-ketoglutarate-dependent dioxygenase alkB homolog 7, mitochondrial [Daktulosphaira vitifoliae]|uniref:alpha-ketoglutarate-dependent dioxygenase alkB homolog 7, mitochondrial n=1 Tax=Daktulosphaira vitifoliae TaxID=58002 RepID=UPI0021AA1C3D|nr:alpha-ketoglutarate-dependent dioxygenase alkB homolog 7, mitochondrial [Daktulosphaira vitifoliae]
MRFISIITTTSKNNLFILKSGVSLKKLSTVSSKDIISHQTFKFIDYQFPEKIAKSRQNIFEKSFFILPDVVTDIEEKELVNEIEISLKRLRYQHDHWDDAIHGYRETEKILWKNDKNANIINKLKILSFGNDSKTKPMQQVHILDLYDDGYVKAHIDSVKFCGNIIAGLSLLSDSIMKLTDDTDPNIFVEALLPRRSLYIMKDDVRYKYKHEVLARSDKQFKGIKVLRKRRISIVMRNEPIM